MRFRLFLTLLGAIGLVAVCTFVIYDQFQSAGDQVPTLLPAPEGSTTVATDEVPPTPVPAAGQVLLAGVVTAVHLEGAVPEPRAVATPLTVSSDRGFGNGGELTGVTVDGDPASIVWDGGRPFELRSGGGLVVDPSTVDLGEGGFRVALGGGAHALRPGTYRLDTPVAVGTAGIATPREGVTFTAGDAALFEGQGDAGLLLDATSDRRFVGPGLVRLAGTFTTTDPSGAVTQLGTFDLPSGAYDLTFRPVAGGWEVRGVADAG